MNDKKDKEKKESVPFELDDIEVNPPVSETIYTDENGNEFKQ